MITKNTGINENHWKKEKHKETDYYLGDVTTTPIFPDGHGWGKYLPIGEYQKKDDDDKMCCVSESHQHCVEMQANYFNYADSLARLNFWLSVRALAKMSGTSHEGNDPNLVCQTFKNSGFTWNEVWEYPGPMSWDSYYSSIPNSILANCKLNISKFDYTHSWVEINPANLKEALKHGPVQVIGFAWASDNGIYHDYGNAPNHAFVIYDFVDGQYWMVYDSYTANFQYDPNDTIPTDFTKKLAWNFKFGDYGKVITLRLKPNTAKPSLLSKLKTMFENLVAYMDKDNPDPTKRGLHVWYTEDRGRQEIPLTTMFEKALAMSYVKEGVIKTTTFPTIAQLPPYKFF